MDLKSKIILIYGPTASGKSSFAINLAKKINGEIVNADSMQIYNDLKIITARPTKKDFKQIKHHLYGIQSGKKSFSTGDWLKLAIKKIQEIKNKKKVPILVGGTGLYFKALVDGLIEIPNFPLIFRNKVRNLQKKLVKKNSIISFYKLIPYWLIR
jgi:tRNA dimethylallyltransferase